MAGWSGLITESYEGRERDRLDECMRSCGIAAQTLMIAARGLGYESCPMDGFEFDIVGNMINLPPDHVIGMFVAIGRPLEPARPRGGKLPAAKVIIENRFWQAVPCAGRGCPANLVEIRREP